jgi:spore germination protein
MIIPLPSRTLLTPFTRGLILMLLSLSCLHAAQKPEPAAKAAARGNTAQVRTRWHVLGAHPLGMYYYYPPAGGIDSIEEHASQMTLLAPQCFWADEDGVVHGEVPPEILEIAHRKNIPLMPLLINPDFDRSVASEILHDVRAQERTAMYMAYLARRDNFAGWQLDFEFIDPADKWRYTQFVARVAARLHRDGRLVSVAVVPRFSDIYRPGIRRRPGEFHTSEWGAPFDYRGLGRVADFLTLMTYDHHGSSTPPGPVAGYAWVKAVLDYAVQRVPRAKLLLGLPFYGREWVATSRGTTSSSLSFEDIQDLIDRPETPRWDERWRTTWFQYQEGEAQHTAWFDDTRSLKEKLKLMRSYGLRGFAAWRLGVEDPQFWPMVAGFGRRAPGPARRAAPTRVRAAARTELSH